MNANEIGTRIGMAIARDVPCAISHGLSPTQWIRHERPTTTTS